MIRDMIPGTFCDAVDFILTTKLQLQKMKF